MDNVPISQNQGLARDTSEILWLTRRDELLTERKNRDWDGNCRPQAPHERKTDPNEEEHSDSTTANQRSNNDHNSNANDNIV